MRRIYDLLRDSKQEETRSADKVIVTKSDLNTINLQTFSISFALSSWLFSLFSAKGGAGPLPIFSGSNARFPVSFEDPWYPAPN